MRHLLIALALLVSGGSPERATTADASNGASSPPARADRPPARVPYDLATTGIEWHRGLDSVVGKERPILYFQLMGELDDALC